jgi:hypothetical protein
MPLDKVLKKLATSERTTTASSGLHDGKMRVTSASWDGEKVLLRDQVLGCRVARARGKERHHDEW